LAKRVLMSVLMLCGFGITEAPATARAPIPPGSQCRNGELTIYSCNFGSGQQLSVCETHGRVSYRDGPHNAPQVSISSNGHDGRLHAAETTGVGGASQVQMRFTRGALNYIVFAGDSLPYREHGPTRSGLAVTRAGRTLTTRLCPDTSPGQAIDAPQSIDIDGHGQEMLPWR
jgi:hypothetical protein